jgi:uncharacterized protein
VERFQKIVWHEKYKETYERLQELEKDRIFCGHNMEHFLSVARITYLMVMERNLDISKDIIYATAFLHDLGRADQYEKGISHEEAGAVLAQEILADCGYDERERKIMVDTILEHRALGENEDSFAAIFYRADKISRDCIHCKAKQDCYWPEEKKNSTYIY